ncbi:MAG: carbohydrate ABC transporter permease [Clostridia bacterium]|nr:carbohydrate ABC transporter permease [Clostridia bacterium]
MVLRAVLIVLLIVIAVAFLLPIVLTIANSFMSSSEISANYGKVFSGVSGTRTFIAEKVNLKFIPDKVSFSQYITVLFKSPDYLLKFWNSVILVAPIVVFQVVVALGASYCFARFQTKFRSIVFFAYIILMLMPYQVTLVPNYLVSDFLGLLDTRWAVILPGIFSPFAVFILTKFMRRIPSSMIEAAKLDGAGEWQIFTKVCVPVCRGIIWSVVVLIFMDYWNMVEQPLVLFKDRAEELSPLSVFLSKINTGDVGLAFAVATIYMVPALLLFMYSEEYLIDGIASQSGIKG